MPCVGAMLSTLTSTLCLITVFTAYGESLPDGKGRSDFERICSACHGLEVVTKMRMDLPGWEGLVNEMVSRGAQGSQDELDRVVRYLATNFNTGTFVRSSKASLQPGNADRGKALVESNGCLNCHRIGEHGSRLGPDLSDIGERRTAEQLLRSILAPDEEVLPEYRFVRVVTNDGRLITGRLLNRDSFTVQLIDSKERLLSFRRPNIRNYTILDKGLMPSFQDKLTTRELADIVNYLDSLESN